MQVIEKITQLEELKSFSDKCYAVPIFIDSKKHRLNNSLSLLYLNCEDNEFMLCFDHSESLGIPIDSLNELSECKNFSDLTVIDLFNYISKKIDINVKYVKGSWLDINTILDLQKLLGNRI